MQLGKSDSRSRIEADGTERAVSPVIGVILMVAITVVLAGVIGVMVFGLADDVGDTAPSATLSIEDVDTGGNTFTLVHDGGDALTAEDVDVIVNGSTYEDLTVAADDIGDELGAGESVEVEVTDISEFEDGDTITIRHSPSESVLKSYEVEE